MSLRTGQLGAVGRGTAILLSNVRDCEVAGVHEAGEKDGGRIRIT